MERVHKYTKAGAGERNRTSTRSHINTHTDGKTHTLADRTAAQDERSWASGIIRDHINHRCWLCSSDGNDLPLLKRTPEQLMHRLFYKLSSHLNHVWTRCGVIKHQEINHICCMLILSFCLNKSGPGKISNVWLVSMTGSASLKSQWCKNMLFLHFLSEDRITMWQYKWKQWLLLLPDFCGNYHFLISFSLNCFLSTLLKKISLWWLGWTVLMVLIVLYVCITWSGKENR